ncbi:transposase [Catenibacterium sp.]|uniref:transposase n=1 Tax=Catenibacterium sp. TaxID=2049022 RepID=UPI003990E479
MSNKVLKPKKASLYQFTQKYSNNIDNCIEFFKSMKWPEGFSCDRCGCHKYYLVKRVGKRPRLHMFLNATHAISNIHCFQALFSELQD